MASHRFRSPRFVVVVLLALQAGCGSSTLRPIEVVVRDRATGAPVADASVRTRPLHLFVPGSSGLVTPFPKSATSSRTDRDGIARLDAYDGHPVQVTIAAPGFAPLIFHLDEHPASRGRPRTFPSIADAHETRLEAEVRPPG